MNWLLKTAKGQLLLVFGLFLALSVPAAGGPHELLNLVAAVVTACVLDGACMWLEAGRPRVPTSALLTALIVFFIVAPNESWLVVAWTSGFAIAAKRLIRTRREHIFNPAALALLWAPLAFGSGESWWGALSELPWMWTLVMVVVGFVLVERLNKLPVVLTFLACYFSIFTFVSLSQPQLVAEMFRAPFVQAALFLALFMLTDPPTSPSRYIDQLWYGVVAAVAACAAQLLGAGQVYLLIGVVAANVALALVRAWRRRGVATVALSTA
jgi:Na+-translocating ferredoxin:NAD+ oxidoreductase RnfD subunit